jgi:hypothetical protein
LFGKPEGKRHSEDLDVVEKIISTWLGGTYWTGFFRLKVRSGGEYRNLFTG